MPAISKVTKRYLLDFWFRTAVFLSVAALYWLHPDILDFTKGPVSLPLMLLWAAVALAMLAQLNSNSDLTTGCLKQYPNRYTPTDTFDPQALTQAVHKQNWGAFKVAIVWLATNLMIGALYHMHRIRTQTLLLLSAFYYLCDLICVLFYCPFQHLLMHNRCCVNCRIFAWGSWMMATPLAFIPHWYSWSLCAFAILVLVVWEYRYHRYPERFWFGSNRNLQCANCKEQLCRYKHPRPNTFS